MNSLDTSLLPTPSLSRRFLRMLQNNPSIAIGGGLVLLVVLAAVLAPEHLASSLCCALVWH